MLEEGLQTSFLKQTQLPKDRGNVFDKDREEFEEMMMMYGCAIKEVQTKLQVLNDELSLARKRNPIEFIKTRIKKPDSIAVKLKKKGLPITSEAVKSNLNDVAGVRVICAFLDDIYRVADMLTAQDDVKLIKTKDYIKNPKENGYRSLHLIIEVPVYFSDHKQQLRVEVQIRTIAMDFWASLEHQVKYKKNVQDAKKIGDELRVCADVINRTDYHMQSIRDRIVEIS
jgi:putative GTP pyrophosphokinase